MGHVEVITVVHRGRRWCPREKKPIVEETEQPGMCISAVDRKCGLRPNQLFQWHRLMREGALSASIYKITLMIILFSLLAIT